ncbi:hypothetical protein EMCRGX_G029343 [Ephydatia muelleri]
MQEQIDRKLSTHLQFKEEVVLRLSDVNVALFSCIQQVAQKQQNLRFVIKGNEIEVAGSIMHIAEFREELQKCVALKSNQHDLSGAQGVLSSLCTAYGRYWQDIGTSLGLSNLLLDGIMATTDDQCLLEVLLVWVSTNPVASWQTLSSTLHKDLNINDLDHPLPSTICSLLTRNNVSAFHGLNPDVLGLMEMLNWSLHGVKYLVSCGCVVIEGFTKSDLDKCIDRFQTAYQDVVKMHRVESFDCSVLTNAPSLGALVNHLRWQFNQCIFTCPPQTHVIRVVSSSVRQLDAVKQAIAGYLKKLTPSAAKVSSMVCLHEMAELGDGSSAPTMVQSNVQLATTSTSLNHCPHIVFGERILKLKKSDIVREEVDAIVNSANMYLKHEGGVAKAINKASGGSVQRQSHEHIQRYGPVEVGQVIRTDAGGSLKCTSVYHVVGPHSTMPPETCQILLQQVVSRVLALGEKDKISFIAFPAISTGVFGVDSVLVARTMVDTILRYPFTCKAPVMADIRIVIIDDLTFDCFAKCFAETDAELNLGVGTSANTGENSWETEAENLGYDVLSSESVLAARPAIYKEVLPTPPALMANQPLGGTMKEIYVQTPLPGYSCDQIWITYEIPGGMQGPHHPDPGQPYDGLKLGAYLPDNPEGREVYKLLQSAWKAGLTFSIQNHGKKSGVVSNVEHKTKISGGRELNGYPDQSYLERVKRQLTEILKKGSAI